MNPNPASSEITIEVNNDFDNNDMKLFDLSSKLVFSSKITSNKCSIDVSSFSKGIYFVEIGGVREKFVVE
ncbi:MAG: T9SS type A sorting domain-containing protein [Flavobacteriia bacterium]|nr:T9SS type A sorting domain-containing protein [Flavobacteriia bacterium]